MHLQSQPNRRYYAFFIYQFAVLGILLSSCNKSNFSSKNHMKEENHAVNFAQVDYEPVVFSHRQGFEGQGNEEVFEQGIIALDLLLIVDNSKSMGEEQVNLSTKLQPLLSEVSHVDWRIKVVSTDPADECKLPHIQKGDINFEKSFSAQVTGLGVLGSHLEQGITQGVVGLTCSSAPWVRPHSAIAVLIVSDEDNCSSDGKDCKGESYDNEQFLIDYINTVNRKPKETAFVYGIIWEPGAICINGGNEGGDFSASAQFGKKWGWYSSLYALANGEFRHLNEVTTRPIAECLTFLAFESERIRVEKAELKSKFK